MPLSVQRTTRRSAQCQMAAGAGSHQRFRMLISFAWSFPWETMSSGLSWKHPRRFECILRDDIDEVGSLWRNVPPQYVPSPDWLDHEFLAVEPVSNSLPRMMITGNRIAMVVRSESFSGVQVCRCAGVRACGCAGVRVWRVAATGTAARCWCGQAPAVSGDRRCARWCALPSTGGGPQSAAFPSVVDGQGHA